MRVWLGITIFLCCNIHYLVPGQEVSSAQRKTVSRGKLEERDRTIPAYRLTGKINIMASPN